LPIAFGVSVHLLHAGLSRPRGYPRARSFRTIPPPAIAAQIREAYGFDKPRPVQYLLWLRRVLTGDFGHSITTRRSVLSEVMPAMLNTFKLRAEQSCWPA